MIEKIIETLSRDEMKEFAADNGWKEMIMTTTESPNYEIENPVSAEDYLRGKFNSPALEAYKSFRLKGAREAAEAKIRQAQEEVERAKESLSVDELTQ